MNSVQIGSVVVEIYVYMWAALSRLSTVQPAYNILNDSMRYIAREPTVSKY